MTVFIDLAKSNRRELPRCDVAVVGAGAAGITLALELEKSGLSVVILEGGYRDFTELSQDRYKGEVSAGPGFKYPDLDVWRLRYFGGTTNHWIGWCRRIEENVFRPRTNDLGDGWPFARADLEDDYQDALEICTLGRDVFDSNELLGGLGIKNVISSNDVLATPVWRFAKELRFGGYYRYRLQESETPIYFGANCQGFSFEEVEGVTSARKLRIKNDLGVDFELTADCFVLAGGGIENVRQLLVAAEDVKGLLQSDNLGRGFLEHPHGAVGAVLCGDHAPEDLVGFTDYPRDIDDTQFKIGLGVNEQLAAERGMINTSFTMEPLESIPEEALHGEALRKLWESSRPSATKSASSHVIGLYARTEQRWNAESRISLISAKDDLGSKRARLDWRVSDRDVVDIKTSLEMVAKELMKAGFGPVTFGDPADFVTMEGGGHHLGGARMHESPDLGVVDANLKCHAVDNLYVVGGSAFPTAGFSNPTLTIVALAVRLARTLKERL
jgi:choline dehydrogenase-like flavoprotein